MEAKMYVVYLQGTLSRKEAEIFRDLEKKKIFPPDGSKKTRFALSFFGLSQACKRPTLVNIGG